MSTPEDEFKDSGEQTVEEVRGPEAGAETVDYSAELGEEADRVADQIELDTNTALGDEPKLDGLGEDDREQVGGLRNQIKNLGRKAKGAIVEHVKGDVTSDVNDLIAGFDLGEGGEEGAEVKVGPEAQEVINEAGAKRGGILKGVFEGGMRSVAVSEGLNLIPFAGPAKMAAEAMAGTTWDGKKMTGGQRVVHGALGVGLFALDFVGAGEVAQGTILVGRSTKLVASVGERAAARGTMEGTARIFATTAEFMAKHPGMVHSAETALSKKIRTGAEKATDYRHGRTTTAESEPDKVDEMAA
ncbi:MAG TPA: hypothetical protein VHQ86_04895 [Candidatus Saccharimonadia bacterium]|jgi:hypothetical protein|nr:hypothetical protein [Candidatus Saccharimonadia bacterium]